MKKFWLSPLLSLFDIKFYHEASKVQPRWGFYYLAYWAAIAAFLSFFIYYVFMMPQMNIFFDGFEKSLPPLAYNADAGLVMSEASPYVVQNPRYGKIVTFDMEADKPTQGQISDSPFFVTAKKIYYEKPSGGIGFFEIARPGGGNGNTVLVNDVFKKVRTGLVPVLGVLGALLVFFAVFLFKVLSGLLFSVLGLGVNLLRVKKLKYSSVLAVTFFALTAMTLLDIFKLTPFGGILATEFGNYISIAVTAVYLFIGIKLTEEK